MFTHYMVDSILCKQFRDAVSNQALLTLLFFTRVQMLAPISMYLSTDIILNRAH